MLNEDEKQEIINLVVEKTLLLLPEVIGNLMTNHMALHKINAKFYADYPEFVGKKNVVQAVVEKIDGENPLESYENILAKAVPEIRARLNIVQNLSLSVSDKLPRDMNGVI